MFNEARNQQSQNEYGDRPSCKWKLCNQNIYFKPNGFYLMKCKQIFAAFGWI